MGQQCILICLMQIGLRQFENNDVEWFREAAVSADYSRYGLAKDLCGRVEWRGRNGKLSITQAYLALPRLAQELGISLPEVRGRRPLEGQLPAYEQVIQLRCDLAQLGEISVQPVTASETKPWRSMMQTCHPLGEPHLPGKAVKYWVLSEHHGRLGGLSFHAANWHERARDQYIGWSQRSRVENLDMLVNNARFLILPKVRVHGLASVALGLATARVGDDWRAVYGETPVLAYTHIDRSHSGQSYRAAGWERIGETSGRKCSSGERKQVYALPLSVGWQEKLCGQSRQRFGPLQDIYLKDDVHWTDMEYGASKHPDGRVRKRILSMGQAWERMPGKSTPQIFADPAQRKAAYRLLSSDNVDMDDILESHRQTTVARCAQREVALAVQDTTGINYDTLKGSTDGLTSIGGTAQGIYAHANVAFSPGGRVLGVLDIDGNFRSRCAAGGSELKESVRWVEGLETAAELSEACGAGTRVVSVCDREGDVWDLFERQHQLRDQVGLLVRRNGSRRRKVVDDDGNAEDLRKHVESQVKIATRRIEIQAQGGKRARKARAAQVALRIAKVQLKAPGKGTDCVALIAVSAIEENPPADVKSPLNWFLLCTDGEADADHAIRICQWYEARWGIKEYFRTLKTGCEVEKRQFDDAEDLLKCLAFDAITSWRVFDLQRVAKHEPDRLASEIIDKDEILMQQALTYHEANKHKPNPPPPPPLPLDLTIRQYVVELAGIAGFRPTKRQPMPGTKKIWQATKKLSIAMIGCEAMQLYHSINQNA